jgi:hypothetical protein
VYDENQPDRKRKMPAYDILVDGFQLQNRVWRTYYVKGTPKEFVSKAK